MRAGNVPKQRLWERICIRHRCRSEYAPYRHIHDLGRPRPVDSGLIKREIGRLESTLQSRRRRRRLDPCVYAQPSRPEGTLDLEVRELTLENPLEPNEPLPIDPRPAYLDPDGPE